MILIKEEVILELKINVKTNLENIHMKYTLVGIETANGFPKPK